MSSNEYTISEVKEIMKKENKSYFINKKNKTEGDVKFENFMNIGSVLLIKQFELKRRFLNG